MSLISVDEARARVLDAAEPLAAERVPLAAASGRTLAEDLAALRTQPPFDAAAMDGYALRQQDAARAGAVLAIVGEVAAGAAFAARIGPGEAVRIFTGAPVPAGADTILIQENARRDGDRLIVETPAEPDRHIRRVGLDFRRGDVVLAAGARLAPRHLALAAAANHAEVAVRRRPRVGLIATGDELVPPGGDPGPTQIVASNAVAITALVAEAGSLATDFGIVPDDPRRTAERVRTALAEDIDILVTLGGASVGDHDLVRDVLGGEGMALDFWRVAMRPGKPLLHGRLGRCRVLGLPGNPVSSLVCALLFLVPLVERLSGRREVGPHLEPARLAAPLAANDRRQDYIRARLDRNPQDLPSVTAFTMQDSSMLSTFAAAGALIVRPPFAGAASAGQVVDIITL